MTDLDRADVAWRYFRFTLQWSDIAYAMLDHGAEVERRAAYNRAASDCQNGRCPRWCPCSRRRSAAT